MSTCTIEICAGCLADALAASKGGADRIELNSALPLGGLSPTTALLRQIKERVDLPVICMIRPRGGGFDYTEEEFELMLAQARELLEAGADGIAFGFLDNQRCLDEHRTRTMTELAHQYGKEAVFHRAFDLVDDPEKTLARLADLHVDRILTSGTAPDALQGAAVLADLVRSAGGRIEILAGCGITPSNVRKLIEHSGVRQVHASCSMSMADPCAIAYGIDFSEAGTPRRKISDPQAVAALVRAVRSAKQPDQKETLHA